MKNKNNDLEIILSMINVLIGAFGIITIPAMVSQLYLYYVLEKGGREFTREGVLGGFIALNGLLALAVRSNDGMFSEVAILATAMATIAFLLYAVHLEVVWNHEVRGESTSTSRE